MAVLILHNPKSGSRHATEVIDLLASNLSKSGFRAETHDSLDAFKNRVDHLARNNQLRAVIAAGGDGTAAAVAARVPSAIPLWLCPLGTENLLARYLGMTTDPAQATAAISRLKTRSLDAGLANGRLFLIMVGVGFDAEVVRQVHTQRKGHIRRWHYWLPILKTMFCYRFPTLTMTELNSSDDSSDSKESSLLDFSRGELKHANLPRGRSMEAAWYFLLNLPRYAAGLDIAPDAKSDDGLIDICAFKHGGFIRGLVYFARLRTRTHANLSDFLHVRSSKFRIEASPTQNAKVSYQLDGDWGGYLPLEVESLPNRLCTIEPIT